LLESTINQGSLRNGKVYIIKLNSLCKPFMLKYLQVIKMIKIAGLVQEYMENRYKKTGQRTKIQIHLLESFVLERYGDIESYRKAGGYGELYHVIQALVNEGRLEPVKSAVDNGRNPELRSMYWSIPDRYAQRWNPIDLMRVSDRLDMSIYTKQPELQTDGDWERIERVYEFLSKRDHQEWATREERSLELFGSEKWMVEGQGELFLRRIGLTMEDLKMKVYGEPFVFWPRPGTMLDQANEVLMVENLSLFHTIRRVLERDGHVLGLKPDLLIYGEGKKIESSLPFLSEIVDNANMRLLYAGDMDPEGWSIYVRLKQKYPEYLINLAIPLYERMAQYGEGIHIPVHHQRHQEVHLHAVLDELRHDQASAALLAMVEQSWKAKVRIPQEVLTVETLRKGVALQ
jgi:hypothetical protein